MRLPRILDHSHRDPCLHPQCDRASRAHGGFAIDSGPCGSSNWRRRPCRTTKTDLILTGGWRRVRTRQRRGASPLWSPLQAGNRHGRYTDVVIPYNEQRPVFDTRNFFGRDEEAMQLSKQVLGDAPSMVFLAAPRRTGKTSLALRFLDTLDARDRPHRIRVDLRAEAVRIIRADLRMIAAALKPVAAGGVKRDDDPRVEIASIVRQSSRRVLLILDEFGAALESCCAGDSATACLPGCAPRSERHLVTTSVRPRSPQKSCESFSSPRQRVWSCSQSPVRRGNSGSNHANASRRTRPRRRS